MRVYSTGIRIVIIGVVFITGIVVGTMALDSTNAKTNINPSNTQEHTPSFPVNKNGETYGSGENAAPNAGPDLVQAVGVDGTLGYVRAKDLETEMPKSPEEALSKQRSIAPGSVRKIPLYDVNGKEIGTFNIQLKPENGKLDRDIIKPD